MASATSNTNDKAEDEETITISKKVLKQIISAGCAAVQQLSQKVYDNGGYSYEYQSKDSMTVDWLYDLFYVWRREYTTWDDPTNKRSYMEIAEDICERFHEPDYYEGETEENS